MLKRIKQDIQAVKERDPAATSTWTVVLCSPGLHALWGHRFAHWFYCHDMHFLARLFSHWNRFFTGVEIHPAAQLGNRVFIDHGMGVVIGETAEVGDNVTIYKGVVLGGTGKETGKRHPTIGHNVVVSSNAIVLGSIKIGNNVKIGAGSVVLRDVPDNCTVVGVPGRIVVRNGNRVSDTAVEDGKLYDPIFDLVQALEKRVQDLEKEKGEHNESL